MPRSAREIIALVTPKKKRVARENVENTTRSMGTRARRKFVASLPCAACGIVGYSQNAHLLGNGGMGRKKDATTIGPLCGPHPDRACDEIVVGCHTLYDEYRWKFDAHYPAFNPELVAAQTEQRWNAYRENE